MKRLFLLIITLNFTMLGCGSSEGLLDTSMVTASANPTILDSDIVAWVDAGGTKAAACAATSLATVPAADSVDVRVVSRAYPNATPPLSSLRVVRATIHYTPVNPPATPPLATEYQTLTVPILNGGTATVPIRIATQEQKGAFFNALACQSTIYNYYANIVLDIEEDGTKKKTTVSTSVQLRFSDYVDK